MESAKLFELITNNTKDLIVLFNCDFSILYISPSVKRLLGYELFEIVGKKMEDIFAVEEPLRVSEPQILAFRPKNKTEKILLESLIKPILLNDKVDRYLGILRDVDIRENLKKELEAALKKEKEINENKSKLISMASHELKNPLATISSSLELLSFYIQDDPHIVKPNVERHIEKIHTQLNRLNEIVNELLTMEKTKAQNQDVTLSSFDLITFISTLINDSFSDADQAKIKIKCKEDILYINSNKILLHHIFKNLIENAIKYSKPDKTKIQVLIEVGKLQVDVSVKDNGVGVNPLEKDKVFDQFYRSSRTSELTGFGLGLSIVKECASMLDAKVTLKSTIDKGSFLK
ncbi:PAS domain-containing sensor histidine kinase [Pedobacter sp. SL55]|uniref:PAS domain-containing sensor histidine kinase n=1 Tax=Pedobacter sp. SL55 TaxID=2995161 RepID=UPI0022720683|nr:PAS domain-containing sensor histidine kinase [Pedobacter sp. SL55]WAC42738.1 PAS domain-containing sensor histidine kinase [Pedobacter sp. SL55]